MSKGRVKVIFLPEFLLLLYQEKFTMHLLLLNIYSPSPITQHLAWQDTICGYFKVIYKLPKNPKNKNSILIYISIIQSNNFNYKKKENLLKNEVEKIYYHICTLKKIQFSRQAIFRMSIYAMRIVYVRQLLIAMLMFACSEMLYN